MVNGNYNTNTNIIKPVAGKATIDVLKEVLAQKNIILEALSATASGGIAAQIKDGPFVLFADDRDAREQVSSLQLILSRLTIGEKRVSVIDLRGSRPIVKF